METHKLKLWKETDDWDQAETAWDSGASAAAKKNPLKGLKQLPDMVGITPDTAKNLKWKSLKWMLTQDHAGEVRRGILKHPLKYTLEFLKSMFKKKPYKRNGDFFLYGVDSINDFEKLLMNDKNLFVIGFSYCHKPFECPSGRFTDACIHDPENAVCRQCFIGKCINAVPEKNTIPLLIPTVHYIGGKIFEAVHNNPDRKVIFMITACEMTLEMFGDWGNMVGIQGIGIRLGGRICNTMKAFELSERGIKPGLTVVLDDTQEKMLNLIRLRRSKTL
jgi:hypothetical protein